MTLAKCRTTAGSAVLSTFGPCGGLYIRGLSPLGGGTTAPVGRGPGSTERWPWLYSRWLV